MSWSYPAFAHALNECHDFRKHPVNTWCTWWSTRPGLDEVNAWRLYRCAFGSSLGMLLLGSAKIRKDPALVGNFGVTSGAGPTDPQEIALVRELEQLRQTMRQAPGLADAPDVMGTGSILSDKTWTPLLNDAFILGGVHAGHEFHLAEDAAQHYFEFRQTRALFEKKKDAADAKEQWTGFFRAHPEMLWDKKVGAPRVLARELIGLKTFGYSPEFSPQQLSFAPTAGRPATFKRYLDALLAAGCLKGGSDQVLAAVSGFLFGREDVFRSM
jgi:hypothetical protein